jgi:hypothetical protein
MGYAVSSTAFMLMQKAYSALHSAQFRPECAIYVTIMCQASTWAQATTSATSGGFEYGKPENDLMVA